MEYIVFMRWINFVLQSCDCSYTIRNMGSDLSDGLVLIDVLECITGKKINDVHLNAKLHKHKVENIILIKKFLDDENVEMMGEIGKYHVKIEKF